MADAERAIEALNGYSIVRSKVRLSWDRSVYLYYSRYLVYLTAITCPFLDRSSAASIAAPPAMSATPQSPRDFSSGLSGSTKFRHAST